MNIKRIIRVVTFLTLIVSPPILATPAYNQVYVFGDSLSDTGNLASIVGPFPSPPFYENRVSNGPVAVEILAKKLGTTANASLHLIAPESGTNYSVAGANAVGIEAIDLPAQLSIFLANHSYVAPANALYVIFIGGNDIRSVRTVQDKFTARSIIDTAVQQIKLTIKTLVQSGAHSFLLVNAPNIGIIPETRILSVIMEDPTMPKRARKLSNYFRIQLDEALEEFEHTKSIRIVEFDLYKYFNKLIKKSEKYGFINSTDACFSSITFTFNEGCDYGENFDQYIFFDEIHPTARVHSIIGNAFYKVLTDDEESDD